MKPEKSAVRQPDPSQASSPIPTIDPMPEPSLANSEGGKEKKKEKKPRSYGTARSKWICNQDEIADKLADRLQKILKDILSLKPDGLSPDDLVIVRGRLGKAEGFFTDSRTAISDKIGQFVKAERGEK